MKATLILVILLPICTQAQTYIKVRPGDRLIFKADTSTMYIEIVPDMVRDTVFVNGDSALVSRIDHIIDQIPRMEVADLHTWLITEEMLTILTQIKAMLEGNQTTYFAGNYTDAEAIALKKSGALILFMGTKSTTTLRTPLRGYK